MALPSELLHANPILRWHPTNGPIPTFSQFQFSECAPADGANAAVDWRDYGGSRQQLSNKTTLIARARGRGFAVGSRPVLMARIGSRA
jgi:hypothetical protein